MTLGDMKDLVVSLFMKNNKVDFVDFVNVKDNEIQVFFYEEGFAKSQSFKNIESVISNDNIVMEYIWESIIGNERKKTQAFFTEAEALPNWVKIEKTGRAR